MDLRSYNEARRRKRKLLAERQRINDLFSKPPRQWLGGSPLATFLGEVAILACVIGLSVAGLWYFLGFILGM